MQSNGFDLLLPDGVLDYFVISKVEKHTADTTIYLQEKISFQKNILVADWSLKDSMKIVKFRTFH